jgi:hypothetical protein
MNGLINDYDDQWLAGIPIRDCVVGEAPLSWRGEGEDGGTMAMAMTMTMTLALAIGFGSLLFASPHRSFCFGTLFFFKMFYFPVTPRCVLSNVELNGLFG